MQTFRFPFATIIVITYVKGSCLQNDIFPSLSGGIAFSHSSDRFHSFRHSNCYFSSFMNFGPLRFPNFKCFRTSFSTYSKPAETKCTIKNDFFGAASHVLDSPVDETSSPHSLDQSLDDLFDASRSLGFSFGETGNGAKAQSYTKKVQQFSVSSVRRNDETSPVLIGKLSEELENLRQEHRDLDEIADVLSVKGQYAGDVQFQVTAIKKRKLRLKDRITWIENQLNSKLRENMMDDSRELTGDQDPIGLALGVMMKRLKELGLKPEQIPPHKDSYFLALMKCLQRAGLSPNGYDFREGSVMGSTCQYPYAAKRAKFDVLKLLTSQADKLNGIGGWKLSAEEFQKYFSKAWWTLPAARHDLFMASAHLFSLRIVVLSIEASGLDEQVYDPPRPARATIYLCRRDAHVISTSTILTIPASISVHSNNSLIDGLTALSPSSTSGAIDSSATNSAVPSIKEKKEQRRSSSFLSKEDLNAGLGLLDHIVESPDDFYSQAEPGIVSFDESFEDNEVVEDRDRAGRAAISMYEAPTKTKRVFVAVTLNASATTAVSRVVDLLRRDFPLGDRLLDGAVRWVDSDSYHVTLEALDVESSSLEDFVASVGRAIHSSQQRRFTVTTGELGTFWRCAGTGWGRVPRVLWLGLDGAAAGPLLSLREALEASCGHLANGFSQPFCAHITLAKTRVRAGDGLAAVQRRALRALGKWVQDPTRPTGLQQLLASCSLGRGGGFESAGLAAGGRGGKRARSWLRQVDTSRLSGRQKQAVMKALRKHGRDVGGLNAGLVEGFLTKDSVEHAPSGSEAADLVRRDGSGIEIAVDCVAVVEAVPKAGSGHMRYNVLQRFPLQ